MNAWLEHMVHHQAEFENDRETEWLIEGKEEVHWPVMPYAFGTEPSEPNKSCAFSHGGVSIIVSGLMIYNKQNSNNYIVHDAIIKS